MNYSHTQAERDGKRLFIRAAVSVGVAVLLGSTCTLFNKPPTVPVISGPSAGVVGVPVTFKATATDPDGDSVAFQFDWGDTSNRVWSNFIASGETLSLEHVYSDSGTFLVRAKAKNTKEKSTGWCAAESVQASVVVRDYPDSIYAEIPIPDGHCCVAITPDGNYLYVAKQSGTASVIRIRLSDRTVLPVVELESFPYDIVASVDGSHLYVALRDANKVLAIRTSDNVVDGEATVDAGPQRLAVTPDGQRLVVSVLYPSPGRLVFLRTSDLSVTDSMRAGISPYDVAINRAGTLAYVVCRESLRVVNLPTHVTVDSIPVDSPQELVLSHDESHLYLFSLYGEELLAIRLPDLAVSKRTALADPGTRAQAATWDDRYLICSEYSGVLYVDTQTLTVVDSLNTSPVFNRGAVVMHPAGDIMYMVGHRKVYVVGPR